MCVWERERVENYSTTTYPLKLYWKIEPKMYSSIYQVAIDSL